MELLNAWANVDPKLLWGLLSRGMGFVFLVSFVSLSSQVLPTAGRDGVTPISASLRAIERHFPTWKRFFYFPTLLWLDDSDAFLGALPWLGVVASSAIVVGGPWMPWAFAVSYLVYLSLDRPMGLIYPWDCMLFECGFWGMFLPSTRFLPDVHALAAPAPAVAWIFRLLVFRVLIGFGKQKFLGTTPDDKGFLKSFFINQPLPTPLGWAAHFLPMWVQRLALAVMFLVEIPIPFTVFFPGPWSVLGALAIANLMVGISLTGNFGNFNLAVIVVSLSWFDSQTASSLRVSDLFSLHGAVGLHALVLLHVGLSILCLPFNTFCAQTWMIWPFWERVRPRWLAWPVLLLRALHPFRWVHGYGVFPPRSLPAAKALPVIQASWDGQTWRTIEQRYSPTVETSRPRFCAPHQDRVDQAVVYEGLGINEASIMRNFAGRFDPYGHGGVPGPLLLMRRMLAGTAPGRGFYDRTLEDELGPPKRVRVRTFLFEPTSISEVRETGKWWRRTLIGPHFPEMSLEDGYFEHPLPAPELWHFDDLIWLRRSHLGRLMERALRGEDPHELVLLEPDGLSGDDVSVFWNDFLPAVTASERRDWTGLRKTVDSLRRKHGRPLLHRLERVASRYGVLLLARLDPLFSDKGVKPVFGLADATLNVKSSHHLRLLTHHILAEGRNTYDRVMRDPLLSVGFAEHLTMHSGNYLQAIFRYEAFVHQSYKLRLLDAYDNHEGRKALPEKQQKNVARMDAFLRCLFGSTDVAEFLRTQFTTDEDVLDTKERWPRFTVLANGEVQRLPSSPD